MNESLRRRLALACCAAMAFAVSACGNDGPGTTSDSRKECGSEVCTEAQDCVDNHCVDKVVDACDNKCTSEQECVDGECKDKAKPENPCDKCTEGQKCVDKVCMDVCGGAICASNQACVNDECIKLCGGEVCKDGQICDRTADKCIDKPTDVDPCSLCSDSEVCVNEECKPADPCASLTCPDNWRCDRDKGACVEIDPCEGVVCLSDQTCVKAKCIDDACLDGGVEKDCGEGKVCSKGACVDDGCADKTCDDGWQCIKGICEETACLDKFCDEGRSCKGGVCVDNECLDVACSDDKICSKGNCIFPACLDKEACPAGKACDADGDCMFIVDPAISLDEPEDKTTDEAGKTVALALHLNNAPLQEVRIACEVVTESPNKEVEAACDQIVFNADNWQNEQTIVVTGVDDHLKDGDQTYKIKVTTVSEDIEFTDLVAESVELTNIDTTKPGFVFSETSLTTYEDQEAEAATFTVVLSSMPASDVSVTVSSSKETEGVVSPKNLTFTKDNWNVPQTVTVKGVDDEVRDGNVNYTVFFAPSESNDEDYNGVQATPIKVTNVDNDVAGISMNLHAEGFELNESQYYPLILKLNTQPKKEVKVSMSADDKTEAAFEPAEITLTPENWKSGVEVQLIGVADHIIDGDQPVKLSFTVTSDDEDYNLNPGVYEGIVKDVDVADIVVAMGDSPIVKEGTNDMVTMSLTLASKPTKEVTVALTLTDESELKLNKKSLTFKPDHWDLPQDILVYSVDDDIVDGNVKSKVAIALSSGDANFNGKSKEIEFTTVDDDEAGFVIVSNAASFPENSASTASMTVALKSQPLADVTVTVSSSDSTELQVTSETTLTFTTSDWKTPKTVNVKVMDDNIADGTQTAYVQFVGDSTDANFKGIKGQSAIFTITDNDSASMALTIDPLTIAQGSPTAMATINLGAEPNTDVKVQLVADNANLFTFEPSTVTFKKETWNTPQKIKLTVDFDKLQAASAVENMYALASQDSIYTGVKSNIVALTLTKIPQVQNFEFTGKVQAVDLPAGSYKFEVWGAQGGNAGIKNGGNGGYSTGIITLSESNTLYIYVGGQGISDIGGQYQVGNGGWNGGGDNINCQVSSWIVGTGGGATDISYMGMEGSEDWNNDAHLSSRIIVAGGGGAGQYRTDNRYGGNGGSGGGTNGNKGDWIDNGYTSGTGGTQTAGGSACSASGGTGKFGTGANYIGNNNTNCATGGGGGGWYGGGACYCGSAAGGSGYTYSSSSAASYPDVKPNTKYYLTNTQTIGGNASMPSPKGGNEIGHVGNGYARITMQ